MLHRFTRQAVALLLLVVAETVIAPGFDASSAAIQTPGGHPSVSVARATMARRTARRHRARRPPPGGVYARCAVVVDPVTNQVLYGKNADTSAPIASITKLMTAMVLLEQKPDLTRDVEVTREELYHGGHTQLRNHEVVAMGDLLHMSLMCSDNVATRVLARESGLSPYEFLARMNAKAQDLGLNETRFVEFTGLDEHNVSTATDVARMLRAAAGIDLIHSITTTSCYEFRSGRRAHSISSTNRLLKSRYTILAGKTGFISESGYCFATWIRCDGRDLIAVVLGAPTNATRFADVVRLVQRTVAAGFEPTKS